MFKKPETYGPLNSYDILKIIALVTMVVDHLGSYFWQDIFWLRSVGRMALPLFLFLVGYSCHWKIKPDLITGAAAVIVCGALTHHPIIPFNILVTIGITRAVMPYVTRPDMTNKYLTGIFAICVAWFPLFLWTDYGTFAVLFAISGWLYRQKPGSVQSRYFFYATLFLHFLIQWDPHKHDTVSTTVLCVSAAATAWLLHDFRIHAVSIDVLQGKLRRCLQWIARNTLPLYALHVMFFMVLERLYFPDRLAHFQWW